MIDGSWEHLSSAFLNDRTSPSLKTPLPPFAASFSYCMLAVHSVCFLRFNCLLSFVRSHPILFQPKVNQPPISLVPRFHIASPLNTIRSCLPHLSPRSLYLYFIQFQILHSTYFCRLIHTHTQFATTQAQTHSKEHIYELSLSSLFLFPFFQLNDRRTWRWHRCRCHTRCACPCCHWAFLR